MNESSFCSSEILPGMECQGGVRAIRPRFHRFFSSTPNEENFQRSFQYIFKKCSFWQVIKYQKRIIAGCTICRSKERWWDSVLFFWVKSQWYITRTRIERCHFISPPHWNLKLGVVDCCCFMIVDTEAGQWMVLPCDHTVTTVVLQLFLTVTFLLEA